MTVSSFLLESFPWSGLYFSMGGVIFYEGGGASALMGSLQKNYGIGGGHYRKPWAPLSTTSSTRLYTVFKAVFK